MLVIRNWEDSIPVLKELTIFYGSQTEEPMMQMHCDRCPHLKGVCQVLMWNKKEWGDHTLRYSEKRSHPFPKLKLLNWILEEEEE